MNRHTPGPWGRNIKPAAKYPTIFAGRNTHVARIISGRLPDDQIEANCDLIAAAPDLLDALRQLVCAADELTDGQIDPANGSSERDFWAALDAARGSLAKAMQP